MTTQPSDNALKQRLDFIELDLQQAIQAKVVGVPVFDCHYGTSNGKYALKVNQLLTNAEQGWLGDSHVS